MANIDDLDRELRQEWKNKLYQKQGNTEKLWLSNADDIANWWFDKIAIRELRLKEKIDVLIAKEMLICHKEEQPTSRLTSLAMKISKL